MIEKMSEWLVNNMNQYYKQDKMNDYNMVTSIMWIVLNPIMWIIILSISLLTGNIINLFLALSFSILRLFSGGKHIDNADLCFIFSITFIIGISYSNLFMPFWICPLLNCVALIVVFLYAPNGINNIKKQSKADFYVFKIVSSLIVLSSLFIDNPVVTMAVFSQSLTILDKDINIVYN